MEQGQRSPHCLSPKPFLTEGVRAEDEAHSRLVSAEKPGPPSREFLVASYQQVTLTASTKGSLGRRIHHQSKGEAAEGTCSSTGYLRAAAPTTHFCPATKTQASDERWAQAQCSAQAPRQPSRWMQRDTSAPRMLLHPTQAPRTLHPNPELPRPPPYAGPHQTLRVTWRMKQAAQPSGVAHHPQEDCPHKAIRAWTR